MFTDELRHKVWNEIRQQDLRSFGRHLPDEVFVEAAELALVRRLQLWDSVICVVSSHSGAKLLLSEDLQDGGMIGDVRVINPFNAANETRLADLIGDLPQ